MMRSSRRRRLRAGVLAFAATAAASMTGLTPAHADAGHTLIVGSGSSWAANAVQLWGSDVSASGMNISFTPNGSAQGRQDFANEQDDFAVSDIGYQGVDPITGQNDTSLGRAYAYLPIVAGGTSLPYNLVVGGKRVVNLRLSGETLTKIFTNQITNWDDPEITKDNNGHAFPNIPIIPVVHSEGSGDSYQFTAYMSQEFPSIWKKYFPQGATEYFPPVQGSQVAENGSDGVINFVTSSAGNGSIGYDEYSYALGKGFPVAKLLNKAGYYTLPTQYNVAVALTKAIINMNKSSPNYLLQNLVNVYGYNDPRVYPMSSYSYGIIPTSATDSRMGSSPSAKRQTIADYLDFAVCQGQQQMGPVGYSPLPINLVQASFDQVAKLHAADKGVDVTHATVQGCDNPTFDPNHPGKNFLAEIAPLPQSCDKQGQGPCVGPGDTGQVNPVPPPGAGNGTPTPGGPNPGGPTAGGPTSGGPNPGGPTAGGPTSGGGPNPGGNSGGPNPVGGTTAPGGGSTVPGAPVPTGATPTGVPGATVPVATAVIAGVPGASPSTSVDPLTGQTATIGAPAAAGPSADAGGSFPTPPTLPASNSHGTNTLLAVLAGVFVVLLLFVPPVVATALRRRQQGGSGR